VPRVATEVFDELQLKRSRSCNQSVYWVAIEVHVMLQVGCLLSCKITNTFTWYFTTPSVATGQWFELQSMYTLSCKYWVLPPNTVLPLQLQLMYTLSCKYWVLPPNTVLPLQLQLMYTLSYKYWVLPPDTVLPISLQTDNGSSCNRCILRVANTEFSRIFHLVSGLHYIVFLFYNIVTSLLLSCNWFIFNIAIRQHYHLDADWFFLAFSVHFFSALKVDWVLQLKCLRSCNLSACRIATGVLVELQFVR
jgi:hypothetical protein